MTDLSEFITKVHSEGGGISKPHLYEINIFNQHSPEISQLFSLYCHSCQLPGYSTETKHARIYGLDYEVPINIEQDPIWLSFYADSSFNMPNFFLNTLRKHSSNKSAIFDSSYSPRYKEEYATQVIINILNAKFEVVSKYLLTNCFFKVVQQAQLDSSSRNAVQTITCQLIYEEMTVNDTEEINEISSGKEMMRGTLNKAGLPGTPSAGIGPNELANPESLKKGFSLKDTLGSVTSPFKTASAAIAAVREKFNSLGITDALNQVTAARKAILDPLHQVNEGRALLSSTLAQINSVKSATAVEIRQGKAIIASFDKLF